MNRLPVLIFILIAFSIGIFKVSQHQVATGFQIPPKPVVKNSELHFKSSFASAKQHTQTHAASTIELKDGRIRAFWFSGSREGAKDVEIHSAVFDPKHEAWSVEQTVATREGTEHALMRYVSKLGNPVAVRAEDGTLCLYYVTVSMGGWAGSSLTAITSNDEGESWKPARRLITSPFLNISTLIKGAPFFYRDSTIGLPVYHEFISKFGEILHFDQAGNLIDKQRLSNGKDHGLQPVFLVKNTNEALVLMRHAGDEHRKVIGVSSTDGGQNWSVPAKLALSNPDAALTAVTLADGRILAVLNNQEQQRDSLALMSSTDGGNTWIKIYPLEDQQGQPLDAAHYLKTVEGEAKAVVNTEVAGFVESVKSTLCTGDTCRFEFSYPYLLQTQNGDFHLVYTWNRSFIKHVWFTRTWLDQRLAGVAKQ
jgi:predicted neuraminidase